MEGTREDNNKIKTENKEYELNNIDENLLSIEEPTREKRNQKHKQYDNDYVFFNSKCKQSKDEYMKLENFDNDLTVSNNINNVDVNSISIINSSNEIRFNIGDLVWAKVSGHPWWPCMISTDHSEDNYVKLVGITRPKRMFYVEFFGPSIEHAWVTEGCLIEYKGIEAFKTYAQDQVDQAPTKSQKEKLAERFQLKVALTRRDHWERAVDEADNAMNKRLIERKNIFTYKSSNNTVPNSRRNTLCTDDKAIIYNNNENDENITLTAKNLSKIKSDQTVSNKDLNNKRNKQKMMLDDDGDNILIRRKRLSNRIKSNDKDSKNLIKPKLLNTESDLSLSEILDTKSSTFNNTKMFPTEQKREIRKPKFFLEQEKLLKVQQEDNLSLLSQIAMETQFNNNAHDTKIYLKENNEFEDKNEKETIYFENKLEFKKSRRHSLLEKDQTNKQNDINDRKHKYNRYYRKNEEVSRETSSDDEPKNLLSKINKRINIKEINYESENFCNNNEKSEISSESNDDTDDILDEINVEYDKLQQGIMIKKESICSLCELPGLLIDCQGTCLQSFHLDCVGLLNESKDSFKCEECISGHHKCFLCKKDSILSNQTKKCSSTTCGKYYHEDCVRSNDLFRKENNKSFLCPLHICITCFTENRQIISNLPNNIIQSPIVENNSLIGINRNTMVKPNNGNSALNNTNTIHAYKGRFMKCVRCPRAYHNGDFCMAAGSIALAGFNIICPDHFQPIKGQSQHNRVNVTWCFVCCKSGDLLGCDSCPAAYHHSCLDNPPAPPSFSIPWTCEDCEKGKRPLHGEIVWVKVGVYRWWPAQICHPRNLPKNIREKPHLVGEFPVRFFGTNDYFWVTKGRCFSFAEDDECNKYRSNQKGLALAFEKGVHYAKVTFKHVFKQKMEKIQKFNGRDTLKCAKYNFQFIKTCKPYGNVIIHKLPLSDLPRCECDPKSQNPCGTDDCLNRILKYECHPGVCPAGERCQNQRFLKRQYPRQEPIHTGARGWGLKTLVDIKKGEFVNEYVGELIDEEECKKRLELAHENDITNFYFLTIDKDRIVDAGPKGNLSRFMNHSCEPNLETQKWNVNGDIRVGLFAICDITACTELTFNYNLDCLGNEKAVCNCGAKNCSGFLGLRPKNINNNYNIPINNGRAKEIFKKASKKRKLSNIQLNKLSNYEATS